MSDSKLINNAWESEIEFDDPAELTVDTDFRFRGKHRF